MPTSTVSGRSSTPSWPPRATATSSGCWTRWIRRSPSGPTAGRRARVCSPWSTAQPAVATSALTFRRVAANATRTLVNGLPGGVAWTPDGRPFAVLAFTVVGGRIVEIDVLADPERLARLDLADFAN